MGPRENPSTIIQLNGHSIKMTLSDLLLHPQIRESLNP